MPEASKRTNRAELCLNVMRTGSSGVGLAIGTAAALLCAPAFGVEEEAPAATQTASEPAVWTPRELSFVYLGFTAQYSCDGLRDRVTDVLLQLGARQDLEVRETACVSIGQPDPFPGVRIRMNVLQPAVGHSAAAGPTAVPAHWKRVDLASNPNSASSSECELTEQIRTEILPLFATRNVEYGSNCQPHQLQVGAAWLRADVLVPDQDRAGGLSKRSPGPAPGP
jgi:hypothetical protein